MTKRSKRGLTEFDSQPSTDWLEKHRRFTHKTADGVRITFHKRKARGKRSPTWNGVVCRTTDGKRRSVCAYAGTSETFDLEKVTRKIHAKLGA